MECLSAAGKIQGKIGNWNVRGGLKKRMLFDVFAL